MTSRSMTAMTLSSWFTRHFHSIYTWTLVIHLMKNCSSENRQGSVYTIPLWSVFIHKTTFIFLLPNFTIETISFCLRLRHGYCDVRVQISHAKCKHDLVLSYTVRIANAMRCFSWVSSQTVFKDHMCDSIQQNKELRGKHLTKYFKFHI